jgi:hypothetical protein
MSSTGTEGGFARLGSSLMPEGYSADAQGNVLAPGTTGPTPEQMNASNGGGMTTGGGSGTMTQTAEGGSGAIDAPALTLVAEKFNEAFSKLSEADLSSLGEIDFTALVEAADKLQAASDKMAEDTSTQADANIEVNLSGGEFLSSVPTEWADEIIGKVEAKMQEKKEESGHRGAGVQD